VDVRRIRADEWRLWREARLRMLREEAAYFSTRYEDVVREPETVWRSRTTEAAEGVDKVLFVAEDAAVTLGVVGAFRRLDPTEVQLVSLWVDPEARGRGVAQSLIRAVASWARERGADEVVLFVQEANAPGRALYLRAGFRPTGARKPVGPGRPGFKLVVSATVDELLAHTR
jgi:ribosomal protein S18 acetylase RimI-like enzyme